MNYTDNELQAAIDAAMLEIGNQLVGYTFAASLKHGASWPSERRDRLALAKAFLAKLPQPQPILADDGRSLTDLRADNLRLEKELAHQTDMGCQAAVCGPKVALDEVIRRMEAVTMAEIADIIRKQWLEKGAWIEPAAQAIHARLIAAARGEAVGINGLTEAEEANTAPLTFEAHGKTWNCHTKGDPMPCDGDAIVNWLLEDEFKGEIKYTDSFTAAKNLGEFWPDIVGWRYADKPDSTNWKVKYEQTEAELAAIKSSQLGILRPINEAGPIPDGCVRVKGYRCTENAWALAHWENRHDTHFADIRIPEPETLKKTTKEIPNDQILQQAIDEACQEIRPKVQGSLVLAPDAPLSWPAEANARLTLAKLFLSKLP